MLGDVTMWRPNEPVAEDISDLPGNGPQNKPRRSRRHAWRDGLADQTVIKALEHVRSYRAFERALIASVDPRSVLELALAHWLASLLWRLRGAGAIETGLFEIQGELLSARGKAPSRGPSQPGALQMRPPLRPSHALAQCFLRLSNVDPTLLHRVGSYEARLWRQAAQTIWTLEEIRRPPPAPTRRRFRKPAGISYWDAEC